ncbi:hypothetical protein Pryu01_01881 [Paraliobacillus ryukyuensis]|uniref:Uncharacterized protein n=1 Tax=Paraliobacillus ryukyuensis TaxID=200904 RepID=A0A366DST6_9BACI|nr:hypothetical protein [Paraliobacillus ryukyuensis]RBO93153.1 hypothetical protein DES48_11319 [Paraliobacillus ryukyuensis]
MWARFSGYSGGYAYYKEISNVITGIISLICIFLWIAFSKELEKPSKERNKLNLIALISAGVLSTLIITVSLFQNLQLYKT